MRPVYVTDRNDSGPKPDRKIKPGNPPDDKAGSGPDEIKLPKNDQSTQSN